MTLVDGAQVPGMMKLDVHDLGCDMYASSLHKWVMVTTRQVDLLLGAIEDIAKERRSHSG